MNVDDPFSELLPWCEAVLGPVQVISDHTREHPGARAGSLRLRAASGETYLKLHRDPAHWASEAHGYERWAPAFGRYAPRLLGVHDGEPLAVLISALPGKVLEETHLSRDQELAAWRAAGSALAGLHSHAGGAFFGPLNRDGSPAGQPITDPVAWVESQFEDWLARGEHIGALQDRELKVVNAARALLPAFQGERPTPCHRDYCPANWLVDAQGRWAGVIDFEFSYWDVRAADYTRYPEWSWIDHPERIEAFFDGYGRRSTPAEEQQRRASLALYALGAVVWGGENDYHGFAAEGRRALEVLGG